MLAFSRVSGPRIALLHADGSVTDLPIEAGSCVTPLWEPAWFPNGERLAYLTWGCGDGFEIAASNLDGTDTAVLTHDVGNQLGPAIAPDGQHVVYMDEPEVLHYHLWSMRADGTDPRQLTFGRASDRYPDFSPDGRWVVFARWPSGGPGACRLMLMHPDGTRLHRLATGATSECPATNEGANGPEFSPDGRQVAFESARSGRFQVYVLTLATGRVRRVTHVSGDAQSAAWLAGGRIAFERWDESGSVRLWSVRVDGTDRRSLSRVQGNQPAAWYPARTLLRSFDNAH